MNIDWKAKTRVTIAHFGISLLLAMGAAGLVYFVWYPAPYRGLLWGQDIYVWLIAVDAVLGPMLTFVLFNPRKKTLERFIDFSLIGCLQIGALLYGTWALAQARPLYIVFEYDKFQVVPDYLVPDHAFKQAPENLRVVPWGKPGLLSLRRLPEDEADIAVWTRNLKFGGPPLAAQPKLWQSYSLASEQIALHEIKFEELMSRYPTHVEDLKAIETRSGVSADKLAGLPILSENGSGVIVLLRDTHMVVDLLVLQREKSGW